MTLADDLTDADATLESLLTVDPAVHRTRFAWLRDYSESRAPSNVVALLDRLEYARDLWIGPKHAGRIHAARFSPLVDRAAHRRSRARAADVVAQISSLGTRLADATLAMFEKYMGSLFTKAQSRDESAVPGHKARCRQGTPAVLPHHRGVEASPRDWSALSEPVEVAIPTLWGFVTFRP